MSLTLTQKISVVLAASAGAFAACSSDSGGTAGAGGGPGSGGSTSTGGTTGSGGSAASSSGGSGAVIQLPDGGDSGSIDIDGGCAGDSFTGDRLPANMLFVIDRSGSMNCNLPEDGQTTAECETFPQKEDVTKPSKWELTRTAIKNAIDLLGMNQGDSSVGVTMFPLSGSNCGVKSIPDVQVATLDAVQNAGIDAFLDTVSPQGSTPLAGATILGYDYMHTSVSATGNKFIVLLTDGAETCKPTELPKLLGVDVPAAQSVNIRTFVIGVPGSEDARALLSQMAFEGGTASNPSCVHDPAPPNVGDCHFDMTQTNDFSTDLAAALDQISGSVLTCEFDIPSGGGAEVDLGNVNVRVNGTIVPKDEADCATSAEGWQYAASNTKIVLCGQPCADAVAPNAEVSIVLGCPSVVK